MGTSVEAGPAAVIRLWTRMAYRFTGYVDGAVLDDTLDDVLRRSAA